VVAVWGAMLLGEQDSLSVTHTKALEAYFLIFQEQLALAVLRVRAHAKSTTAYNNHRNYARDNIVAVKRQQAASHSHSLE
jgi:hypothetical protein